MKIAIFDVSNGLCALAVCNNGYSLMLDCGTHRDRRNPIEVINELKQPGNFFDHMVNFSPYKTQSYPLTLLSISHPDEDHIRNVNEICNRFPPALLHRRRLEEYPTQSLSTGDKLGSYKKLLCDKYRGHAAKQIQHPQWAFNRTVYQIPMDEITSHPDFAFGKVTNNSSIVTLLEYRGWKVLFGGDLETVGWEWLVKHNRSFYDAISGGIDVLVAPHHGHKSAFPKALFKVAGSPRLSVLSKGSEFGDKSDVDSRYSGLTTGMQVNVLSQSKMEFKKAVTSRRNGQTYLDFSDPQSVNIYTEK